MLAALWNPAASGAEAVTKAGLTIVESSILGAITILAIAAAAYAIWKLGKIQDKRVSDLQAMNRQMESYIRESQEVVSRFTTAVQNLTDAERGTTDLLTQLKWSIDHVVQEAVRNTKYARSYSPGSGIPQQGKPRGG